MLPDFTECQNFREVFIGRVSAPNDPIFSQND
jgi:hypothetical protein